jgi:Holliday junction resolvase RusA-like endonuclease
MTETVICLPFPPSVNNLFAGQKRRYRSAEYEAWITEAGHLLNRQRPAKCLGRVSLTYTLEEPKTKRRRDLGNLEKAGTDLLVSHGVIEGDDQRFVRKITLEWSDQVEGMQITVSPANG